MGSQSFERIVVLSSRYLSIVAVIGSLAGSILMFFLGSYNIYLAFSQVLQFPEYEGSNFGSAAVISVIEGLDRFLIAIVLLYFAYGVYTLFLHPESSRQELALPDWLRVGHIGQLKQVVAEVIIVVLFVLFLRLTLEAFSHGGGALELRHLATLLLLPVSIVLLALALRLVQLHPKPSSQELETEVPEAASGAKSGK